MHKKLPEKLNKPPMIEGVFEIRFQHSPNLENIILGLQYDSQFKNVKHLPAYSIPPEIRLNEQNLQYAPIISFELDNYIILYGERVLTIACRLPYPGWSNFKKFIHYMLEKINENKNTREYLINRYSIKYIDFLDNKDMIDFNFNIGSSPNIKNFIFKSDIQDDEIIHSIQVISDATINQGNIIKHGAILDIDSIYLISNLKLRDFLDKTDEKLEYIHEKNKKIFFNTLTSEAIEKMEPIYGDA